MGSEAEIQSWVSGNWRRIRDGRLREISPAAAAAGLVRCAEETGGCRTCIRALEQRLDARHRRRITAYMATAASNELTPRQARAIQRYVARLPYRDEPRVDEGEAINQDAARQERAVRGEKAELRLARGSIQPDTPMLVRKAHEAADLEAAAVEAAGLPGRRQSYDWDAGLDDIPGGRSGTMAEKHYDHDLGVFGEGLVQAARERGGEEAAAREAVLYALMTCVNGGAEHGLCHAGCLESLPDGDFFRARNAATLKAMDFVEMEIETALDAVIAGAVEAAQRAGEGAAKSPAAIKRIVKARIARSLLAEFGPMERAMEPRRGHEEGAPLFAGSRPGDAAMYRAWRQARKKTRRR